jgi:hypothetical protein
MVIKLVQDFDSFELDSSEVKVHCDIRQITFYFTDISSELNLTWGSMCAWM